MEDSVNHPKHYNSHPSGVECITITEHMNFNIGNAVKYLWRAGIKGAGAADPGARHLEDLKKAAWYIEREIWRLSKPPAPSNLKSWKPGQSGNPNGRPRGKANRSTIAKQILDAPAGYGAKTTVRDEIIADVKEKVNE